ncbi:bacterio-opsin activator [Longibacter salinarum]|uniref:Bacterio-opsin activator n=1 Tax=Longibacter salinarum TaxID=1850348 RepID=A0A2A8D0A0_9BACT|nr:SRPBCC family protein [Longibacter salinarum]PEN14346.1 bacterio-opsin activator [Longibacter salinarum]
MLTVRDDIWIAASPEAVFDYVDVPERQPVFTPSLRRSELIERLPNDGARARYTFSLLGLSLSGEVRATDYEPPERIVFAMTGNLRGSIRWYLDAEDGGTRFTYAATYAVPGPVLLQPLLMPIIRGYNRSEIRTLLHNLKTQVEQHEETTQDPDTVS